MIRSLKVFCLSLIILMACNNKKENQSFSPQPELKVSQIKLMHLNDQPLNATQYKGKALFINFWATWCKPCVAEMPTIKNAMDSLKNENIEFLFATDESAEDVQRFEAMHNFEFNYVRAANMEELNITVLPTTYIFDKDGKRVFAEMGYRKWDDKANFDLLLNLVNQ